jgi:hypothetical protein
LNDKLRFLDLPAGLEHTITVLSLGTANTRQVSVILANASRQASMNLALHNISHNFWNSCWPLQLNRHFDFIPLQS